MHLSAKKKKDKIRLKFEVGVHLKSILNSFMYIITKVIQ